ncbi:MAG: hypothetical protein ACE5IR_26475 [bacterium]
MSSILMLVVLDCSCDSTPFSVITGIGEFIIVNDTGRTLYHWAVEQESLAHINYTLNRCPDSPDQIEPDRERSIKLKNISGYEPGKKVVLFWWVLGKPNEFNCFEPDRISTMVFDPLKRGWSS